MGDLLGATNQDKNDVQLASAMKTISKIGKGAVVLLRDLSPTSIRDQLATINNKTSKDSWKFKNYGAGAQILVDLGLKNILLLTNSPKKPVALDSYGLKKFFRVSIGKDSEMNIFTEALQSIMKKLWKIQNLKK